MSERAPWNDQIELTPPRTHYYADDDDVCSVDGCGVTFDRDGYLIDITVLTSPGEEGYAEVTQLFCQEHYEQVAPALRALGFKSHNHHGTNLLDAEKECGGYGKCTTPAEYGPELVRPNASGHSGANLDAQQRGLGALEGDCESAQP